MGKTITYLDSRSKLEDLCDESDFCYLFRVVVRCNRGDPIFFDAYKTKDGKRYKVEVRELRHGLPVSCMECLIEKGEGTTTGDTAYVFVGDYLIHGFDFELDETLETLSIRLWLNYTDMVELNIPLEGKDENKKG